MKNLLSAMLFKPISDKDEYLFLKEQVGKDVTWAYYRNDSESVNAVKKALTEMLDSMNAKDQEYFHFEMKVSEIVKKIEGNGIPISTELLHEVCDNYQNEYLDSYVSLQSKCQSHSLNLNESFITGREEFHEAYSFLNPELKDLRKKWRKKNLMNYAKWSKHIKNGRIYCTYLPYGTTTGRIQTKNPNVQGLPGKVREKCFLPSKDKVLIFADYTAEELVLASVIAEDSDFIADIRDGIDFHKATAAALLKKDIAEISKSERNIAKEATFMTIYGAVPSTLEKKFSDNGYLINGKTIQETILARYPMIEKLRSEIEWKGYIQLLTGRKIDCTTLGKKYTWLNYCIQTNAAIVLKSVIIELDNRLPSDAKIVCLIHDEIILEVNAQNYQECIEIVKGTMENALNQFGIVEKMPLKINARKDNMECVISKI